MNQVNVNYLIIDLTFNLRFILNLIHEEILFYFSIPLKELILIQKMTKEHQAIIHLNNYLSSAIPIYFRLALIGFFLLQFQILLKHYVKQLHNRF